MSIQIGSYTDGERLRWAVVSNDTLISQLALLADALGFGWCGGTRQNAVGTDFDRSVDGSSYIAQAHYASGDPHASGYMADQRLRITLSNFRLTIDPRTFVYTAPEGPPPTDPADVSFSTIFAKNYSDIDDTATQSFDYALTDTVSHTVSVSFTEGVSVSVEASAGIPFLGGGSVTTEFSFSSTQGWTDGKETSTSTTQTIGYSGQIPAHSQRQLDLMVQRKAFDLDYTAHVGIDCQIDFHGFLRWGGNAKATHPTDRPTETLTFGSATKGGIADILSKWQHRDIAGSWPWVDWSWVEQHYPGRVQSVVDTLGGGITAGLSGSFNDVRGVAAYIKAGEAEPVTGAPHAAAAPTSRAVFEPHSIGQAASGAVLKPIV